MNQALTDKKKLETDILSLVQKYHDDNPGFEVKDIEVTSMYINAETEPVDTIVRVQIKIVG